MVNIHKHTSSMDGIQLRSSKSSKSFLFSEDGDEDENMEGGEGCRCFMGSLRAGLNSRPY